MGVVHRLKAALPSSIHCCFRLFSTFAAFYGKPNGAKFKNQNWLHIQQVSYQAQERFQSSSTKSSHFQLIFSQGQDIILRKLNKMKSSRSTNFFSRSRDV